MDKHMTQEEALEKFRALRPNSKVAVSRERFAGDFGGHKNMFSLWDTTGSILLIVHSNRSFEHALAVAESGNEDVWPEDDSPIYELGRQEARGE